MRRLKTFRKERIPNLVAAAAVTLLAAGAILGADMPQDERLELQAQAPEPTQIERAAEAPAEQAAPARIGKVKLLLFRRS